MQKNKKDKKKGIENESRIINIFGVTIAINLAISYYATDAYKYIALILHFQDYVISAVFMSSTFLFILSNYIISYAWTNFGFDVCFMIVNSANFIALLGILLSRDFYLI